MNEIIEIIYVTSRSVFRLLLSGLSFWYFLILIYFLIKNVPMKAENERDKLNAIFQVQRGEDSY